MWSRGYVILSCGNTQHPLWRTPCGYGLITVATRGVIFSTPCLIYNNYYRQLEQKEENARQSVVEQKRLLKEQAEMKREAELEEKKVTKIRKQYEVIKVIHWCCYSLVDLRVYYLLL